MLMEQRLDYVLTTGGNLIFAGGTGDPKWLTREYRGSWKLEA
mgnify:CR=1 FL=1